MQKGMTTEIVVAHYSEDLEWCRPWMEDGTARVYWKGECPPYVVGRFASMHNKGREAHTFLHHIVFRWDRLADWTVFLQGDPFPHLPKGEETLRYLLTPEEGIDFKVGALMRVSREHLDEYGQIKHNGPWARAFMDGTMRRARMPYAAWLRQYVDVDIANGLLFIPGAQFGVSKSRIEKVGIRTFQRLLDEVKDHPHPEEAHYIERLWYYLFTS